MQVIKPSFIIEKLPTIDDLKLLEKIGRVCYKSEDRITDDSYKTFLKGIIKRGHHSILEHITMTVRFICDRGVSHELVRHRLCAFSQESTRYCNYRGDVTFIQPCFWEATSKAFQRWERGMQTAEALYTAALQDGATPQEARAYLPNSVKTEIVVTTNLREWRHIFNLRAVGTTGAPHHQMRELMLPLLTKCYQALPIIFEDIYQAAEDKGLIKNES